MRRGNKAWANSINSIQYKTEIVTLNPPPPLCNTEDYCTARGAKRQARQAYLASQKHFLTGGELVLANKAGQCQKLRKT